MSVSEEAASALAEEFQGFAEDLSQHVVSELFHQLHAEGDDKLPTDATPSEPAPATAERTSSDEVKITVTGKMGKISPTIKTTISANGKISVYVEPLPVPINGSGNNVPGFLIPDSMTPVEADVGVQGGRKELEEAMIKKVVEILLKTWIEIGLHNLPEIWHFIKEIHHLPLRFFGLKDIPAIPVQLAKVLPTGLRLLNRLQQQQQALEGLNNMYTIDDITTVGYEFMFGGNASPADEESGAASEKTGSANALKTLNELVASMKGESDILQGLRFVKALTDAGTGSKTATTGTEVSLQGLSLEDPTQWSMSWTTWPPIYQDAQPLLDGFAATFTNAEAATERFWPTIAEYGLAYDLFFLEKVTTQVEDLKKTFGGAWTEEIQAASASGHLYLIDLSIFESVKPQSAKGETRFTPATLTLLIQDPKTKALRPAAIRVCGHNGSNAQIYTRPGATDSAWLYALQAAKTSITVYGIWLGHVYQWHIVTAAMQMTFFDNIPDGHPIYDLLSPQSKFLIPFDTVLLLGWGGIAPPTSITSGWQFLKLCNTFANGREFFDDDPPQKLANLGIDEADFTDQKPWDQYPIIGNFMHIWGAASAYIGAFVDASYPNDQAVEDDAALQAWMKASADPGGGNIRGLPKMNTREALARVLTSLIYRLTIHGSSRLSPVANPGLTFVGNYPPCLQDTTIPAPDSQMNTKTLLSYMPKTGTIGDMVTFYFTFSFSPPYESFIPMTGVDANLFFPKGKEDPRNVALVAFREAVLEFMATVEGDENVQRFQWPLNIET